MKNLFVLFILLILSSPVQANFTGTVTRVFDGDTITILTTENRSIRVRLLGVGAPETDQLFGNVSTQALSSLLLNKQILVIDHGYDKYNRLLGTVYQGNMNINAEQIKQGMGWVYRKYSYDPYLIQLENEARLAKRGIWSLKYYFLSFFPYKRS